MGVVYSRMTAHPQGMRAHFMVWKLCKSHAMTFEVATLDDNPIEHQ